MVSSATTLETISSVEVKCHAAVCRLFCIHNVADIDTALPEARHEPLIRPDRRLDMLYCGWRALFNGNGAIGAVGQMSPIVDVRNIETPTEVP